MHKLTPNDLDKITAAVVGLRPIEQHVRKAMPGRALLDLGYYFFDGKEVMPENTYVVDTVLAVNHVAVIADLCRESGMEALEDAVSQLKTAHLTNTGTLLFVRA